MVFYYIILLLKIEIFHLGIGENFMKFLADHIITAYRGGYFIVLDSEKNFSFLYESEKGKIQEKPDLVIPSDEIDHFIKGLFVQASRGLGRTTLNQLIKVLEYRYSDEFEEHMKENRESYKDVLKELNNK